MTSSSHHSESGETYLVLVAKAVQRAVQREHELWVLRGTGPSRLEAELAEAFATLAAHPFAGRRIREHKRLHRYLLRNTGFWLVYRVRPRRRVLEIVRIVHGRARY